MQYLSQEIANIGIETNKGNEMRKSNLARKSKKKHEAPRLSDALRGSKNNEFDVNDLGRIDEADEILNHIQNKVPLPTTPNITKSKLIVDTEDSIVNVAN
jgi:hypothetical protein